MPKDPNLYGQAPPRKRQKQEINLPSSTTFTSELSSLLASSSSKSATVARPRPSKSGNNKTNDPLSNVKIKRKATPTSTTTSNDAGRSTTSKNNNKLNLRSPTGTEEEKAEFENARRRMESKARLYAAMQRGDYIGKEIGLVDFDRKWAEKQQTDPKLRPAGYESSSGGDDNSDSDSDSDNTAGKDRKEELVEYTDEFGRVRLVTPAQKSRMEARVARGQASALELEVMSGRPIKAPSNLIFGDAVQAEAFEARDAAAMEEIARKRDRSPTPPPLTHYDADKEIRTKGVGFFNFSKDEEERNAQMKSLEQQREGTLRARIEKQEKEEARKKELEARKKELEERRRAITEKRAKKMADSFLEELGEELFTSTAGDNGAGGGGGGGGGGEDGGTKNTKEKEGDK